MSSWLEIFASLHGNTQLCRVLQLEIFASLHCNTQLCRVLQLLACLRISFVTWCYSHNYFQRFRWPAACEIMVHPLGRQTRWRNLASSKLINVKLPAQALLAFLLIMPVSALILLKHDSLSNIPASLHTESNFSSAKDFNLLESLSLQQHQMARRLLLQKRAAPTGFPPPAPNGHTVSQDPSSSFQPPSP